jgi:hypothetical protein
MGYGDHEDTLRLHRIKDVVGKTAGGLLPGFRVHRGARFRLGCSLKGSAMDLGDEGQAQAGDACFVISGSFAKLGFRFRKKAGFYERSAMALRNTSSASDAWDLPAR